MLELIAVAALVFIGWELGQILRAIQGVELEMSTARWERGKRRSGAESGLDGPQALDGQHFKTP